MRRNGPPHAGALPLCKWVFFFFFFFFLDTVRRDDALHRLFDVAEALSAGGARLRFFLSTMARQIARLALRWPNWWPAR